MLCFYKDELGDYTPKLVCAHCGQSIKPEDDGMFLFQTQKDLADSVSRFEQSGASPSQEIYQGLPVHRNCIKDFEQDKGEFAMSDNADRTLNLAMNHLRGEEMHFEE